MNEKQEKEKDSKHEYHLGLYMGANISCQDSRVGRVPIPIPEDFGNFTVYDPLDQPYESICYDCKKYKLGNILRDSTTKELIFICGDCFEIRVEKIENLKKGSERIKWEEKK